MNPSFQRVNNIAGWLVFGFATIVYFFTMEATTSFWDCGEFISAAYKLQVVHPPGAPIFLMLGRMFTLFGGPENADVLMNAFSALSTSFAILFLFWTTTFYSWKVLSKYDTDGEDGINSEGEASWADWKTTAAIAAGVVGALAGTFMTSMWFSAVEAEVYALASFFSAIIWWSMTRWERAADRPGGDRWLVFIALMFGLSGGTHLLSLLTIPTVCFMYYFRRTEKVSAKGLAKTFATSIAVLFFILSYVLDWGILMAAKAEVFFVNSIGLPFNVGSILVILLHVGVLAFLLKWSSENQKKKLNTAVLSVVFLLVGFSSYAMVLIRAEARPSINMNGITDVHSFYSYIKREQYGSRALSYGPYFTSRPIDAVETGTRYRRGEEKYEVIGKKQKYIYDFSSIPQYQGYETNPNIPADQKAQIRKLEIQNKSTIFPRMGSQEDRHKSMYYAFLGLTPQEQANYVPDFNDNMKFFFSYQMGHMFWRYFMWNFSGRQNDRQGYLADYFKNGNWISGINYIDVAKHPQLKNLPPSEKNNFSRDTYFMLPFLLGLLGMVWQYRVDKGSFAAVFLFFLFMGVMNIINMNQPPIEPRERDYAMVGAFYAFALWIGLGVMALIDIARRPNKNKLIEYLGYTAGLLCLLFLLGLTYHDLGAFILVLGTGMAIIAVLMGIAMGVGKLVSSDNGKAVALGMLCLTIPLLMAFQNWDNHNRSNRTFALDVARNYLSSCDENAILFTQGDNDTYPLWYAQEVEGLRQDVRIINLSLLGVDWYINTLRYKVNDAPPVPMTLTEQDIQGDKNNYIEFDKDGKLNEKRIGVAEFVRKYVKNSPSPKVPTQFLKLPVDRAGVLESGIVTQEDAGNIPTQLNIKLSKRNLYKNDLMALDILSANNWERPIYFAMTVQTDAFIGLQKYFRHDGMCYQFVPVEKTKINNNKKTGYARSMNTSKMYDIIMSDDYKFGGIEKGKGIYRDPSSQNAMLTVKYLLYQQLAYDLIAEADALERNLQFTEIDSSLINLETGKIEDQVAEKRRRSLEVLDRIIEKFPNASLPYDFNMVGIANMYIRLGQAEKALTICDLLSDEAAAQFDYLLGLNKVDKAQVKYKFMADLFGGGSGQKMVCGSNGRGLANLGTIGACASIANMYEELSEPAKAEAFREKCRNIWTSHMPLFWPEYIDASCKRELQSALGMNNN